MSGRRRSFAWWLTVLTIFALALRVFSVVCFRFHHLPLSGDARFYASGANLLVRGKGFISPFTLQPSASHPPLYLLWLAIPSLFNGGHATQEVQMLWSCVLGAGTVAVVGLAGREIGGARVGLAAAFLAAIYPNLWVHDGMLLSETMAMFTAAMIIFLAYRYYRRPRLRTAVWLGAWCGLGTLARPELILAVPLVLFPLALITRTQPFVRRVRWFVAGGLAAAIVISPWIAYNASRFHERVYVSTNFGITMAAANCAETFHGPALGYKSYPCLTKILKQVTRPGMDESDIDAGTEKLAKRYIDAHRDRLPAVVLARWGRAFGLFSPSGDMTFDIYILQRSYDVGWSTLYTFYIAGLMALAGLFVARRRWKVPIFPLVAFVVIVLASVATTFGQVRYRAPAEPAVILLAGVAFEAFLTPRRERAARAARAVPPPA